MRRRNQCPAEQKTQIVLEVLREEQTVNEISARYGVHLNMLSRWKQEFLERAPEVFKRGLSDSEKELRAEKEHVSQLERKVGQLTYEVDWLKEKSVNTMELKERQRVVERDIAITVKRQAELLNVNRTSVYRTSGHVPVVKDAELALMDLIDRTHTDHPTWGYRSLTSILRAEHGHLVNRKKVRRIMRDMGLYAIYPQPNLSKRYHAEHKRPYLLRKVDIVRADQVWGVDITYLHL